jgi:hypothetical protein
MGNLNEISQWEETIPQKEVTDDVLGGDSGMANAAEKKLTNRTRYLYDTRLPVGALIPIVTGGVVPPGFVPANGAKVLRVNCSPQLQGILDGTPAGNVWTSIAPPAGVTGTNTVAVVPKGGGSGVVMACGNYQSGKLFRSTDHGATWAAIAPPVPANAIYTSMAYGLGLFVAVWYDSTKNFTTGGGWAETDHGVIWSNDDGATWQAASLPAREAGLAHYNTLTFANGRFWIAGPRTKLAYSTDGATWSTQATGLTNQADNDPGQSTNTYNLFPALYVIGDGTKLVLRSTGKPIDYSGAFSVRCGVYTSTDNGVNWTVRYLEAAGVAGLVEDYAQEVHYPARVGGLWSGTEFLLWSWAVATAYTYRSGDGITYTRQTISGLGGTEKLTSLIYADGQYRALAQSGGDVKFYRSAAGALWTQQVDLDDATLNAQHRVCTTGTAYIAGGTLTAGTKGMARSVFTVLDATVWVLADRTADNDPTWTWYEKIL